MMKTTRRQWFLSGAAAAAALGARALVDKASAAGDRRFEVELTEKEWKERLTPEQFQVLRKHATERPGSSPLNHVKETGVFECAGCGLPLFRTETKFDSGTGWPSFYAPIEGAVGTTTDRSFFMTRTEVHCSRCGGHLGHVFNDGPRPTGQRYCINGVALEFEPASEEGGSQ